MHALAIAIVTLAVAYEKDDLHRLAERVKELRSTGTKTDGPLAAVQTVKINDNDYMLMGADNSCANRNFPDVSRAEREEGLWFAGSEDLTADFANAHLTKDEKTGKLVVDCFYATRPRKEYQASPEEVAWHLLRVLELRKAGKPLEERMELMRTEAKTKPWTK